MNIGRFNASIDLFDLLIVIRVDGSRSCLIDGSLT